MAHLLQRIFAMTIQQKIESLREWDRNRPGVAGEHWLVLGAGLLAMRRAGRSRSVAGRLIGHAVGTALMARAASGRGGVVGWLGRLAGGSAMSRRK
jgi:hypothetical protein